MNRLLETLRNVLTCLVFIAIFSVQNSSQDVQCGRSIADRIIRGKEVARGVYPWMAKILYPPLDGYTCAASLITQRFALSTLLCINSTWDQTAFELLLGTVDLNHPDSKSVTVKIIDFTRFEPQRKDRGNDLILLKLKEDVKLTPYIQTICLPPSSRDFSGVQAVVAGWGETIAEADGRPIAYSDVLLEAEIEVVSTKRCNDTMGDAEESVICAGSYLGEPDLCYGDSGGPLMYYNRDGGFWELIGVVQGFDDVRCANPYRYSFYVNVSYHLDWIRSNTDYQY